MSESCEAIIFDLVSSCFQHVLTESPSRLLMAILPNDARHRFMVGSIDHLSFEGPGWTVDLKRVEDMGSIVLGVICCLVYYLLFVAICRNYS